MVHCTGRDSEILVGDKSHIHLYEQGSCATIAGTSDVIAGLQGTASHLWRATIDHPSPAHGEGGDVPHRFFWNIFLVYQSNVINFL